MSLLRNKGAYDALFGTTPETAPDPSRVGYSDYFLRALQFLAANDPLHPDKVMGREELDGEQTDRTNGGHWSMPIFSAYNERASAEFIAMLRTKQRTSRDRKIQTAVEMVQDIGKPTQDPRILAIVREYHYWAAISKDLAAINRLNGIGMFDAVQFEPAPEDEAKAEVAPAPAPAAASPASIYPDLSASDPEPAPAAAAPASVYSSVSVEDGAESEDEQQGSPVEQESPVVSPTFSAASGPPPGDAPPELSLGAPPRDPDDPRPEMTDELDALEYAFDRIYKAAPRPGLLPLYFEAAWKNRAVPVRLRPKQLLSMSALEGRVPTVHQLFWDNTDRASRLGLVESYAAVANTDFRAELDALVENVAKHSGDDVVRIVQELGSIQHRMFAMFAYQYWFDLSRDPAKQVEVLTAIGANALPVAASASSSSSSSSVVASSDNVNAMHPDLSDGAAFQFALDAIYNVNPVGQTFSKYLTNAYLRKVEGGRFYPLEYLPQEALRARVPASASLVWQNTDDISIDSIKRYYQEAATPEFFLVLESLVSEVLKIRHLHPAQLVKTQVNTQKWMSWMFEYQYWFSIQSGNQDDAFTALFAAKVLKENYEAPPAAASSSVVANSDNVNAEHPKLSDDEATKFAFDSLFRVKPVGQTFSKYLVGEPLEERLRPFVFMSRRVLSGRAPTDASPHWESLDEVSIDSVIGFYQRVATPEFTEFLKKLVSQVLRIRSVRPAQLVKTHGKTQRWMSVMFEYQYWFTICAGNPEDAVTALLAAGALKENLHAPSAAASSSSSASGASSSSSEAQTHFSPYAGFDPAAGGSVSSSEAPTYVDSQAPTLVYGAGSRLDPRKPSSRRIGVKETASLEDVLEEKREQRSKPGANRKLEKARFQSDDLVAALAAAQKHSVHLSRHEADLKKAVAEKEELERLIGTLRFGEQSRAHFASLRQSELESLQQQLQTAQQKQRAENVRADSAEQELKTLRAQVLENGYGAYTASLAAAGTIAHLEQTVLGQQGQIGRLEQEVAGAQAAWSFATTDLRALTANYNIIFAENGEIRQTMASLESQLAQEKDDRAEEARSYKTQIGDLQNQLARRPVVVAGPSVSVITDHDPGVVAGLRAQLHDKDVDIASGEAVINDLNVKIKGLDTRVRGLRGELEAASARHLADLQKVEQQFKDAQWTMHLEAPVDDNGGFRYHLDDKGQPQPLSSATKKGILTPHKLFHGVIRLERTVAELRAQLAQYGESGLDTKFKDPMQEEPGSLGELSVRELFDRVHVQTAAAVQAAADEKAARDQLAASRAGAPGAAGAPGTAILQQDLTDKTNEARKLREEVGELKRAAFVQLGEITNLKGQNAALQGLTPQQRDTIQKDNERLYKLMFEMQEKIESLQQEASASADLIEELEARVVSRTNKIATLRGRIAQLNGGGLEESQERVEELEEEANEASEKLDEALKKTAELTEKVAQLELQLQEARPSRSGSVGLQGFRYTPPSVDDLQGQLAELRGQLEEKAQRVGELTAERDFLSGQVSAPVPEVADLRDQLALKAQIANDYAQRVEELLAEKHLLEESIRALKSRQPVQAAAPVPESASVAALRAQLDESTARASSLDDELDRMTNTIRLVQAINKKYKDKNVSLTQLSISLERQLRAKGKKSEPKAPLSVVREESGSIAPGESMVVDSLRARIAQLEEEVAVKDEVITQASARYRALHARVDELSAEKPAKSRYGHRVAAPRDSSSSSSSDSDDEPSSSSRRSGTSSSTLSVGGLGIRRLPLKHVPPVLKTSAQTRRAAVALSMKNKQAVAANTRSRAASNYEPEPENEHAFNAGGRGAAPWAIQRFGPNSLEELERAARAGSSMSFSVEDEYEE